MAKVVKFHNPVPEKFGPLRVSKKKPAAAPKNGQLNLFVGGKVVKLNQLTPFEEALMLDDGGDRDAAKKQYLKAIHEQDSVADAYCNVGIIETQAGNFARAIDCFTRSLKEDPRHFEAHYNLANLYSEVGNFPLARLHYEAAIEIEPSFTNSYFNLALTLVMIKSFKEAAEILTQYKSLAPDEEHKLTDDLIRMLSDNG
jgi:tetratricopeptide (TPR) repeat protein